MVTREEVFWLYRCLLGREPESEEAIKSTMQGHDDIYAARSYMMASREFNNIHMAPVHYRSDSSTMPAARPRVHTVCLASIVKNEALNIPIMLTSVIPLVDFVVIADTGSTDDTKEIALELLRQCGIAHEVISIPFNDFSQARNACLDRVPAWISWILMLDGDEHLVPEDYWRLHALLDADVDGWQLPRFNFFDQEKKEAARPYPDYQKRLIRNHQVNPIRFEGHVHEEPLNVKQWGFAPASSSGVDGFIGGPHIHHMGQVNISQERWAQKHEFYTRLSRLKSS